MRSPVPNDERITARLSQHKNSIRRRPAPTSRIAADVASLDLKWPNKKDAPLLIVMSAFLHIAFV